MGAQKCSNCSAPLELGEIGSVQVCAYCGTDNRIIDPSQKEVTIHDSDQTSILIPIFIALLIVFGGISGFLYTSSTSPTLRSGFTKRVFAPSEIAQIGEGWSLIDHTGMPSDFQDFDLLKNFTFALRIAQNWSTDVQLEYIYITGIKHDGKLDLSAREDWSVDYRFYSPTHRANAISMASVSEEKIDSEIRLIFQAGKLTASISDKSMHMLQKAKEKDAVTPKCTPQKVLEEAKKSKDFMKRPFYKSLFQRIDSNGGYWRWSVSCDGCSSIIVREKNCTLY